MPNHVLSCFAPGTVCCYGYCLSKLFDDMDSYHPNRLSGVVRNSLWCGVGQALVRDLSFPLSAVWVGYAPGLINLNLEVHSPVLRDHFALCRSRIQALWLQTLSACPVIRCKV